MSKQTIELISFASAKELARAAFELFPQNINSSDFQTGWASNQTVKSRFTFKSLGKQGVLCAKNNLTFFEPNAGLRRLILRMG